MFYKILEETFHKEEAFLLAINNIKIISSNTDEMKEENYCIEKGEFINFEKNNKLEKYVIFASDFQLNLFNDVNELFSDATFKVAPPDWFQLLNIF